MRLTDAGRLSVVRTVHTVVYVVMAGAVLAVLWAGLSGGRGPWVWAACGLAGIEAAVFAASGMRCPLTAVAARYGMRDGGSDTWFPERLTRHTLTVFGPLLALGFGLLAARALLNA